MAISDADLWHQVHAQREDGVPAMFLVRDVEPRVDQPQIFVVQMPYAVTDVSRLPDAAGYRRLDAFQEQWIEPACEALGWTFVAWKSEDGSFFLYLYGAGDPEVLLEKLSPFDGSLGFFNDRDAEWAEYAALRELVEQAEAADDEDDGDAPHDHDHADHDHDHEHHDHDHAAHDHAAHDHSHHAHSNNHDHSHPAPATAVKRPRARAETIRETRINPAYADLGSSAPAASGAWLSEPIDDVDDAWDDEPTGDTAVSLAPAIIEAEFEAVVVPPKRRAATVAETPSAKLARGAAPAAPANQRAKTSPDKPSTKAPAAKAAAAKPMAKPAASTNKPAGKPAASGKLAKAPTGLAAKAAASAKKLAVKAAASAKKPAARAAASAKKLAVKAAASAKKLAAKATPARKPAKPSPARKPAKSKGRARR